MRLCRDAGVKVGMRFTMTAGQRPRPPRLLDLMRDEGIDKFYFSHLNYAGTRQQEPRKDAHFRTTRDAMDLLFERCWQQAQAGSRANTSPATTTPTASTAALGGEAQLPARADACAPSSRSGAATPPA
jgi:MoaA/NifB/PqqE/SkfB family radical SAM enzyme